MVRDKGPGKTAGFGFLNNPSKSIQKTLAIGVVFKDIGAFNSPDNDVMQYTWCIYS